MAKYILITHQKGGVGKSTLVFNLAQNLCKQAKVLVIDLDVQGSLSQISTLVSDFKITNDEKYIEDSNNYDFVFIDTPPYLSNKLPDLIRKADLIIVPTKAGILDLLAIKSTIELIKKEGKVDHSLVVFNMIKPNTTLTLDIVIGLKEYGIPLANTHVSDLVSFTRSVLVGGVSGDKNAQKQLDNLTKEVLTTII